MTFIHDIDLAAVRDDREGVHRVDYLRKRGRTDEEHWHFVADGAVTCHQRRKAVLAAIKEVGVNQGDTRLQALTSTDLVSYVIDSGVWSTDIAGREVAAYPTRADHEVK